MPADVEFPSRSRALIRLVVRLGVVVVVAYGVHVLMDWAIQHAVTLDNMPLLFGILGAVLLCYALLMAVPFVPGIELGISLLILRGAEVAPFVYAATVLGLTLAFLTGRFIPYGWIHGIFVDLRMVRACRLIEKMEQMDRETRLAHLTGTLPHWLAPLLGAGRYVVLGALLNVPGNVLIGGGGGIAFAAGFSRLFGLPATICVFVLAVLPVPLAVWLYGADILR